MLRACMAHVRLRLTVPWSRGGALQLLLLRLLRLLLHWLPPWELRASSSQAMLPGSWGRCALVNVPLEPGREPGRELLRCVCVPLVLAVCVSSAILGV